MIFFFFGFYLLLHILLLSVTIPYMWWCRASFRRSTEFAWLIAFPIVIITFAVLAGLLCKYAGYYSTCIHACTCMLVPSWGDFLDSILTLLIKEGDPCM